jgi:hypothetical protein
MGNKITLPGILLKHWIKNSINLNFMYSKKKRKRIATLFSQLCDQFMIRRNYAKTFSGFKTRIISKITSLTVIQYI